MVFVQNALQRNICIKVNGDRMPFSSHCVMLRKPRKSVKKTLQQPCKSGVRTNGHSVQRGGTSDEILASAFDNLSAKQLRSDQVTAKIPDTLDTMWAVPPRTETNNSGIKPRDLLKQQVPNVLPMQTDNAVAKLESDLKRMVQSVQEAARRVTANNNMSAKASDIYDNLVDFSNSSMKIIIDLSGKFYTIVSHMKEMNAELEALNAQLSNTPIASQLNKVEEKIQRNMASLRKEFESSVKQVSEYAGPDITSLINQSISNMNHVINQSQSYSQNNPGNASTRR